jgi:hypothetical protein
MGPRGGERPRAGRAGEAGVRAAAEQARAEAGLVAAAAAAQSAARIRAGLGEGGRRRDQM